MRAAEAIDISLLLVSIGRRRLFVCQIYAARHVPLVSSLIDGVDLQTARR